MSASGELVAALAGLPEAGSRRLGRLLTDRTVDAAWAAVKGGSVPIDVVSASLRAEWRAAAARTDVEALGARIRALGSTATCWHDDEHPVRFGADIDPAPVAFRLGTLPDPGMPHVAIVGTRRASAIGREIARELGAGLAAAGVVVVSGLALGIDGAAHHGALLSGAAPPVAVVGSGPDVVYPRAHRGLWADVANRGALLTEAPLGARPDPWRFPARNRLIAALADLVVVVESRASGGSLLTVDEALRRDVDVMAVPGSVRNGAAVGTNQLIADGCAPARDVADVLMALGLSEAAAFTRRVREPIEAGPASLSPSTEAVLAAVDDGPTSVDQLIDRVELAATVVYAALGELEVEGLVVADGGRVRRV